MRRKGGGKEFIDNRGCRVAEVSDNRRKRKRKEGGTPLKREMKTVLRDPECQ